MVLLLESIYGMQKGCLQQIYLAQISLYKMQWKPPIYVEPLFVLLVVCICFFYHQIFAVLYITIYLWLFYCHFSSSLQGGSANNFVWRKTTYIERYLTYTIESLIFWFRNYTSIIHTDWLSGKRFAKSSWRSGLKHDNFWSRLWKWSLILIF